MNLLATELAAHWRAYRRAIYGEDPIPFAWTAIGHRIRVSGVALRRRLGFDNPRNNVKCVEAVGIDVHLIDGRRSVPFIQFESQEQVERRAAIYDGMNLRADQQPIEPLRLASHKYALGLAKLFDASFNKFCSEMLLTAGTLTHCRKRNRRLYRTVRRGHVSESTLPGPYEPTRLERPKPSRKRFKHHRAVVRDKMVFIRYKGREMFFKECVTDEGAENLARKLNGKKLVPAKVTRTQERKVCPHCNKSVAVSWWSRHMQKYHPQNTLESPPHLPVARSGD